MKWILGLLLLALILGGMRLLAQGDGEKRVLEPKKFKTKMETTENRVVLDVRRPEEFTSGHLTEAQNINYFDKDFKDRIAALDKTKVYFIYCRSGGRSGRTLKVMLQNGLDAYDLGGGVLAWTKEGMPLEQ
jgi:rhodanese-related sulfurtransferase